MKNKINETVVNKIVSEIEHDIKKFKIDGYSQKQVSGFINKCYVKNLLKNKSEDNFCFVGDEKKIIKEMLTRIKQIIKKEFYSKYDSENYFAPIIETVDVDTKYIVRVVENVSEITFEDLTKIVGQDVPVEYSSGGKPCNYVREFMDDGKLIATCKFDPKDEE